MWMLTVKFETLKFFIRKNPPTKKNDECMHITNVTSFNGIKLTNFKKNQQKKKSWKIRRKKTTFDLNLNQHSRNRICVLQKEEQKKII